MTALDPRTPVIVGGGQVTWRDGDGETTPLALMAAAGRAAVQDAGTPGLLKRIDCISVVDCLTWPAPDPGRALAAELGATPRETVRSVTGGTSPLELLRDAAERIRDGQLDVVLLAGGEMARSAARGRYAGGPEQPEGAAPDRTVGAERQASHEAEQAVGMFLPVQYYPLFEHALRGAAGRAREEHQERLGRLSARFAAVAAENPHAWVTSAPDATAIATPSPQNRLVADPYTKLMTANIYVDQAAAVLLCSAQAARAAGIPPERWTFPVATARANDTWFAVEREELHRSPAIAACGAAALKHAGAGIDDVTRLDLYSCFPVAVQVAAAELGIDLDSDSREPTVTGGLTFAGGPASNYVMHSLAALHDRLRADGAGLGLATGVGWFMTKHAVAVLSAEPPERPFAGHDPGIHTEARAAANGAAATAPLEAYTVVYTPAGEPARALAAALLPDGSRVLAASEEADTLAAFHESDPLGAAIKVADTRFTLA